MFISSKLLSLEIAYRMAVWSTSDDISENALYSFQEAFNKVIEFDNIFSLLLEKSSIMITCRF